MIDIFSDFFNTLKSDGKAKAVVEMPYGSVVKLIADTYDYDYMWISENVSENDKALLEANYVSECEQFLIEKAIIRNINPYALTHLYDTYRTLFNDSEDFDVCEEFNRGLNLIIKEAAKNMRDVDM
jgi:hypothetical protein